MFVPLDHAPGHAQADFGEAVVVTGGVEQKAHFFALDLPHSDACYVRAYASGTTRLSYDGKSVDYSSAEDLLARIRTIERAIAGTKNPLPIAGLAGFSRGDR